MGKKEEFIADLYPAAVRVSKQTGMSAELILAQAALETGWGEKVLPGTNNIFNIKDSKGWDGPSKTFHVWEIEGGKKVWKDQDFRVYGSVDEALADRVKFLQQNGRYAKAGLFDEGTLGDLKKEANALQKAGYATDPHYAEQLAKVFNGPTMRRGIALAESRGAPELAEHKPGEHKPAAPAKPADAMADGRLRQGEKLGPNAFGSRQELERAAGTLTYEARASGLTHIDKVVLNASGTGLFAVQGEPGDPAARRVHADKAQAASVPLERSSQQLREDVPEQANAQAPERAAKTMTA